MENNMICNTSVKKGDVVTVKSKYSPSYSLDCGEVVGFTETNINLETDPQNPASNKYSIPINWIEEIRLHDNIRDAIQYANQRYAEAPNKSKMSF